MPAMVQMGLVDAKHIPPEEHASIIAGYLPHERVARVYGGIMRGEGLVFTTPEETLKEEPIVSHPAVLGEAVGHRLRHRPPLCRRVDPMGPG